MRRILELDEGDNLLNILTKLPKSVPYTDLIFQVEAEEFDGRAFAKAWFQYQSLETDEEYENRIKLQKCRQQNDEARERRQYEFLKAKYGVLGA